MAKALAPSLWLKKRKGCAWGREKVLPPMTWRYFWGAWVGFPASWLFKLQPLVFFLMF